ncbi:hypothetical protein SJA_C1-29760 [Sphingobium indicum UT26S]|uniref:Uncharacterized protein n=1 Tax=Sphingobium indicum (strain DSM 16413 / CCM 7287 / MTCC 6362 / UT26 / NBRC 101211 / UT26S) TaxID=452662 RepID=D4Z5C8_SPHIU|nr:hypothetical protein SJA_C1-29760 [Sphingobium indicum UT26S]
MAGVIKGLPRTPLLDGLVRPAQPAIQPRSAALPDGPDSG